MKAESVITAILTKVKDDLQKHSELLNQSLTAENAESVIKALQTAGNTALAEGFKTYLEQNEIRENTIVHDGQKYPFNRTSKKEFQTPFGKTVIVRRSVILALL